MKRNAIILGLVFCVSLSSAAQEKMPALNTAVIRYVESVIGQQVDRGECWDLANQALTRIGASWNHEYEYGERINTKKEQVFPGDIIQFKGVKLKYQQGNSIITESYLHHTAIVYRVLGPGHYELAHQNTGFSGRKVGLSKYREEDMISGKMFVYRPVKKD